MSSRKQSDYLSTLLGDTSSPNDAPSPALQPQAPRQGTTLLARESALARVASGDVRQVTQLLLDPARVRIWAGNARHQSSLTEENTKELIDAILAEGGQKVPAIVRRVTDDPNYEYEVVAGSRRHWAISWLRANSYPEMMFLAQVHALDDESAFRISDIENRARKDVSDYERAVGYQAALTHHYGGKQVRMAERLKLSQGWLSKMLTVASLPVWAVAAFASPTDITLRNCYPLAQRIQSLCSQNDTTSLHPLKQAADALHQQQALLKEAGRSVIPAADVTKRLMEAGLEKDEAEPLVSLKAPTGRTALSVLSSNRNGVSIRFHAGSGATESDLIKMIKTALVELERQGKGLRL